MNESKTDELNEQGRRSVIVNFDDLTEADLPDFPVPDENSEVVLQMTRHHPGEETPVEAGRMHTPPTDSEMPPPQDRLSPSDMPVFSNFVSAKQSLKYVDTDGDRVKFTAENGKLVKYVNGKKGGKFGWRNDATGIVTSIEYTPPNIIRDQYGSGGECPSDLIPSIKQMAEQTGVPNNIPGDEQDPFAVVTGQSGLISINKEGRAEMSVDIARLPPKVRAVVESQDLDHSGKMEAEEFVEFLNTYLHVQEQKEHYKSGKAKMKMIAMALAVAVVVLIGLLIGASIFGSWYGWETFAPIRVKEDKVGSRLLAPFAQGSKQNRFLRELAENNQYSQLVDKNEKPVATVTSRWTEDFRLAPFMKDEEGYPCLKHAKKIEFERAGILQTRAVSGTYYVPANQNKMRKLAYMDPAGYVFTLKLINEDQQDDVAWLVVGS
jgi:hypothetical protein